MDVSEFTEWKPTDTWRIGVAVDCQRPTRRRHFKRLANVLIQLKVGYTAPVLRRFKHTHTLDLIKICQTWNRKMALACWRPLLPYGYSYKASCATPGYCCSAIICNFWHLGTPTLSRERQSAQLSKITNCGLTRTGTGCFIVVPIW